VAQAQDVIQRAIALNCGAEIQASARAVIVDALSKDGGLRREAAGLPGINEATDYRKLRTYNLN